MSHTSSFTEDDDGFILVACTECGEIAAVPDWETASDVWADHIDRASLILKERAINFILEWGDIDGAHHKQWVLDQTLLILTGDLYERFVPDGWDQGIAP